MKTKVDLTLRVRKVLVAMALLFAIGIIGCVDSKSESDQKSAGKKRDQSSQSTATNNGEHDLDGFWCTGHGLPEEKCWKCQPDYRDQCRKDGDWCAEHLRPKSQCFKCDPTLIAKWAKVYEDRTGKKAPPPKNY